MDSKGQGVNVIQLPKDSKGKDVNLIRSYEDFMPYCTLKKEELNDTYHIPLHGFKTEQFKVYVNDEKGIIKVEGERPKDGIRWSRFSQEFKIPKDVYSIKDIEANFGNGVLSIKLPRKEPLNPPFVRKSLLLWLKCNRWAILRIAIAVVVGTAVGGYVTLKYLPSHTVIDKNE